MKRLVFEIELWCHEICFLNQWFTMIKTKFWWFALQHLERPLDVVKLARYAKTGSSGQPETKPELFSFIFKGKKISLHLRKGTTDTSVFAEIFRDEIYTLPCGFTPATIMDIGGNIGIASIYFAIRYPKATIHIFEPVPANLEILKLNIESNSMRNIIIHPYGLGQQDDELICSTENAGAFGNYTAMKVANHVSGGNSVKIPIRNINSVLSEIGLSRIDLIKMDCEGAELDLFRSLDDKLNNIEVFVGELHPHLCNANEAIHVLSQTHLVDFEREYMQSAYSFRASRKPWNEYCSD